MEKIKKNLNNSKKMKKLLKNVKRLSLLLLLNSFLISCVRAGDNTCPTIVLYSKEFQNEVADALERAKEPVLYELSIDYINLREKLRVK